MAEGSPPAKRPAPFRAAAVGVTLGLPCGVRDYAGLLAAALAAEEVGCSLHWLEREGRGLAAERAQVRAWLGRLERELREERPDAVLLHYSVFTLCYRGLPLFVGPLLGVLRRAGSPVVTVVHEPAYPWHLGGAHGKVWAAAHRAVLPRVVRGSAALAVTAGFRADWLRARRWLPSRPTEVSPVFTNLPAASDGVVPRAGRVGLFGFAHEGIAPEIVLDAIAELAAEGTSTELALLGAPGRESPAGERWLQGAAERGLPAPRFSGRLPAAQLADELAACEVLLSADRIGPTSRRTTLAASLAAGRPVVALDGPRTWSRLRGSEAVRLVGQSGAELAAGIAPLLADAAERERLAAAGRAFAAAEMSAERSARRISALMRAAARRAPGTLGSSARRTRRPRSSDGPRGRAGQ